MAIGSNFNKLPNNICDNFGNNAIVAALHSNNLKELTKSCDAIYEEIEDALEEQEQYYIEIENFYEELEEILESSESEIEKLEKRHEELLKKYNNGTITEDEEKELRSFSEKYDEIEAETSFVTKDFDSKTKTNIKSIQDLSSALDLADECATKTLGKYKQYEKFMNNKLALAALDISKTDLENAKVSAEKLIDIQEVFHNTQKNFFIPQAK